MYRRSNLTVHKSAEVCRRGLAVAPSRDLYDELSGALRLFARFDEAAEVLRQGQQFSKDRYGNVPLEFWFQLGEVLKLAGRRDEALQAHETTLALCEILNQTPKPKKDVPMRMLAFELRTLWAMGRREEAMGKYQEIRQGWDPTNYIYELEHHAPDTPARLDRLAEVIGGRDVFVLMHGPSVAELEARIGEFADRDICFMTAHGFALFEERMLGRIGRQCDLAMVTNPMTMLAHFDQLEEFLRRDGDNLLLTGRKIFDLCERDDVNGDVMIDRYDDKLMLFPPPGSYLPPSPECPLYYPLCNTLSCMLPFLVLGGARRVFLFGCDGTSREAADGHHRYGTGEDSYRYQPEDEAEERMLALNLLVDTLTFDEVADLSLQSAAFLYNRPIPPIHNVSPGSHLQLFPKIDVDGCLAMLDGDGTR